MQGRIYISGPITGFKDNNRAAFIAAETELRAAGFEDIFNPIHNGLPDTAGWSEHMRADIKALMECQTIYVLKNWHISKGASLELHIAKQLCMDVYFEGVGAYLKEQADA